MATASTHQSYQAPITCGICKRCENVNWYCRDCKGNLCDPCQAIHVQAPIYRKHSIIPILEGLRLQAVEEECGTHTSYLCSFHCNTCHTPVCNKCITSVHKHHDICDIEAALQKVHLEIPRAPKIHNATFEPGTVNRSQLAVQIGELLSPKDQLKPVSILNRSKFQFGISLVNAVDGNHAWVRFYQIYKELRLVNINGDIMECIYTKFDNDDFAVTTSTVIIMTDYNGRCIRIMTKIGQVTNIINTTPNYPSGVCLGNNNQEIVVCVNTPDKSSSKLVMYSRDGEEIRNINYTDKPVGQYTDQRVTQNDRGDYCVVHRGHHKVYVVDSNGALKYTYDGSGAGKMKKKFLPFDICSDIYNHLFISDYNNHNIHMLDDEGKFLRFILTEQDGITKPTGLSIDKDGRLLVGQGNGGLYVVKYLE